MCGLVEGPCNRDVLGWVGGECVLWGEVRERAAIDVRGRERSRVLCFYGVSDVAAYSYSTVETSRMNETRTNNVENEKLSIKTYYARSVFYRSTRIPGSPTEPQENFSGVCYYRGTMFSTCQCAKRSVSWPNACAVPKSSKRGHRGSTRKLCAGRIGSERSHPILRSRRPFSSRIRTYICVRG